jgi:hypothetical protein
MPCPMLWLQIQRWVEPHVCSSRGASDLPCCVELPMVELGKLQFPLAWWPLERVTLFSSQMMLFECLLLCEVCGPHLRRACFVSTLKLSSQNHRLSELNRLWELIHVQSLWTLVSRSTGEFIKSENARSLPPKNLICRVLSRNPGTCIFQKVPKWPWSSTLAALPGELYINVNAQASSLESLISNFILFCGSRTRVWI